MTLDWELLREADAALGIDDPASAAEALNAQTDTVPRDILATDARAILLVTGEYGALVLLSRQTPSVSVPAALVAAAISAIATLDQSVTIQVTDPVKWGAVQTMLAAFVAAGAISETSRDALLAMRDVNVPRWPVTVTEADITHARSAA